MPKVLFKVSMRFMRIQSLALSMYIYASCEPPSKETFLNSPIILPEMLSDITAVILPSPCISALIVRGTSLLSTVICTFATPVISM